MLPHVFYETHSSHSACYMYVRICSFLEMNASFLRHCCLIWKRKQHTYICVLNAAKYEKQTPVSYIAALKTATIYSIHLYKNSQLGWCFESFTLCDQLVIVNGRERVYFEQQILALLLVHHTHNLSFIKFAHVLQQVDGLCISWSSLKAYRMKPSMLQQKQPWIWMKNNKSSNWYDVISCSQ